MASIPKAPEPPKTYQVTVVGRYGKNPPTVTFSIEAPSAKQAQRDAMRALVGGRWTVSDPNAAEPAAAPARTRRARASS